MTQFMLLFPAVLLIVMMVAWRGFGATVLQWIWSQKALLAFMAALFVTAFELMGMQSMMGVVGFALPLLFQLLFSMFFMVAQFGAMMWIMSRPRVYWRMPGEEKLSFDDYVGNPVVKQLVEEIVQNIKTNNAFKEMKGQPSRGVLFSGPPGTGKSFAARIVASVCDVPFCYCDAASLQSMFMGAGNMTVNSLYRKARKYARKHGACILFLDEIDAIGQSRGAQGSGGMPGMMGGMMGGAGGGLLNTLLTNLDPISTDGGFTDKLKRKLGFPVADAASPYVLTMAATNIPERLDPALIRDGRFDLNIIVDLPDVDGREEMLHLYLAKIATAPELDTKSLRAGLLSEKQAAEVRANVRRIALRTGGWSPATIKVICTNKAVAEAARNKRTAVTMADVEAARRTKSFGMKQPLLSMPKHENRRVAYHEGGHALIGVLFRKHMRVEYATIIRRDNALGLVASAYENERHTVTKAELINDIRVALASRAVEIEVLNEEMSGFSGDLAAATNISATMIMVYGMDDALVSAMALGGGSAVPVTKVNRMLQREMSLMRAFVRHNKEAVAALAETLYTKEEMDGEEIYELLEQYFPGLNGEDYITDEIRATAKEIETEYLKVLNEDQYKTNADVILKDDKDGKAKMSHGWEALRTDSSGAVHTWARQDMMSCSCCRTF